MSETDISRDIRKAIEAIGVPVERVQTGMVRVRGGWMHLANDGTPDLWTPLGWLEVKRPGEEPDPEQKQWHARAEAWGVRVAVVTSVREAVDVVMRWKANREHERSMGWA